MSMFSKRAEAGLATPLNPNSEAPAGTSQAQTASNRTPSPFKTTFEPVMWNEAEAPSRQSTYESTVASESDHCHRIHSLCSSDAPGLGRLGRHDYASGVASDDCRDFRIPPAWSPELHGRLARVQEQRGWRYFIRHTLKVPLAFTSGISLGAMLTAGLLIGFNQRPVAEVQRYPVAPYSWYKSPYPETLPPKEVPQEYMEAPSFNNSGLIKNLAIPDGPQTFDACAFVIESTDAIWNERGDVDAAIEKYFHEEYLDAGSWGRRIIGKKALRDAVFAEMRAFPDIKIHITDCVCKGNDNDGYKCAMPDVLDGTNTGPSAYGPPTGRYARWTGLVESFVKRNPVTGQWQYYAEWGVHDEWALIQQLGLDFSRVPHPWSNNEPLHDGEPLMRFLPKPTTMDKDDLTDQQRHALAKLKISF